MKYLIVLGLFFVMTSTVRSFYCDPCQEVIIKKAEAQAIQEAVEEAVQDAVEEAVEDAVEDAVEEAAESEDSEEPEEPEEEEEPETPVPPYFIITKTDFHEDGSSSITKLITKGQLSDLTSPPKTIVIFADQNGDLVDEVEIDDEIEEALEDVIAEKLKEGLEEEIAEEIAEEVEGEGDDDDEDDDEGDDEEEEEEECEACEGRAHRLAVYIQNFVNPKLLGSV